MRVQWPGDVLGVILDYCNLDEDSPVQMILYSLLLPSPINLREPIRLYGHSTLFQPIVDFMAVAVGTGNPYNGAPGVLCTICRLELGRGDEVTESASPACPHFHHTSCITYALAFHAAHDWHWRRFCGDCGLVFRDLLPFPD